VVVLAAVLEVVALEDLELALHFLSLLVQVTPLQ
jgi:hypothetical protein